MKLAQNITQRQQAGLKLSQELHRAIGFLELSNLDLARHLDDVAGDNPCLRLYLPRTHGDLAVEVASPGPSLIGLGASRGQRRSSISYSPGDCVSTAQKPFALFPWAIMPWFQGGMQSCQSWQVSVEGFSSGAPSTIQV